MTLRTDLAAAINRHSAENGSNTPDFILAEYLHDCLMAFDRAMRERQGWYAHADKSIDALAQPAAQPRGEPDPEDVPVTRPWKDASPDFQAGYRAGWADREADILCGIDRVAPVAHPAATGEGTP